MTDAVIRNSANITQKLSTGYIVLQILHHMHNYKLGNYGVQHIHVKVTS